MFDIERSASPEWGQTAKELMRGAEREIAEHGYSGAQLKRAAKRLGKNPAQYNYYFSGRNHKAIEGVADIIFAEALREIDGHRIKMVQAMDAHYGVSSFSVDEETNAIDTDLAVTTDYDYSDILRLAVLPVTKYILDQFERHEISYFGRFSLMMHLESPHVYQYIAQQLALPGLDYLRALTAVIDAKHPKTSRLTTSHRKAREQILRMQWLMLAGFETDVEDAAGDTVIDCAGLSIALIEGMERYLVAGLLGNRHRVSEYDRKLLHAVEII